MKYKAILIIITLTMNTFGCHSETCNSKVYEVWLLVSYGNIATLHKMFTPLCLCHQALYFGTGQLGIRKGIPPVKCWCGCLSAARCKWFAWFTAFSLSGQFAPRCESANKTLANSLPGLFAPWPSRALEPSLLGPFAPWPSCSVSPWRRCANS